MGNAGSTNMHRERHKSTDSTPNSPFREHGVGGRDSISSASGAAAAAGGGGGAANQLAAGGGQAFTFDKKPDTRSVLHGGSSLEDDDQQPYYTKAVDATATTTGAAAVTATTTTTATAAATPPSGEFAATAEQQKRQRASTISEGTMSSATTTTKDDDAAGKEDSASLQEDSKSLNNPALPTVLRWDGGGRNVMISGTFSQWKPIPMVRSHTNFVTIIDLPEGEHQYKFLVDGEWKHDPKLKSVENAEGEKNNLVSVRQSDFEVFQALAKDSENAPNYAEKEYSQEVPQAKPWEKVSGPPFLPPHLLQVILNKDTPLSCEPTLLPEPNHVMLNHLYALSIKDGVMVLSATHRYRKKYVTTLLYKPI